MRWIGLLISVLGGLLFVSAYAFQQTVEAQGILCQVVEGERLIGSPVHLLLPSKTEFVKGTGPNGSRFIERSKGPFRSVEALTPFTALAKMGALAMLALGAVGYQFEKWRHRTGAILTGRPPDL
jgi:hypothetical protein